MIKASDYIFDKLVEHGVRHVFMIAGGGAMHLNDSLGREKRLKFICNHHEQACAMAAEGYARVTGKMGVINVTTGPGGINALNGVFGAWIDSIPMLIISGQVKRETCARTYKIPGLRQLGDQEADIISLVQSITKYAVMVDDPESIRYHLEKAIHLATSGRPGPCWLDIPLDIQASLISEGNLPAFVPEAESTGWDTARLPELCRDVINRLQNSSRPVIMVGSGIWLAQATSIFHKVIRKLGVPVTTAWTAPDLIDSEDPLFCGRPGTIGDRAGNFTVQNADTLLIIGCRLNLRQIGYNWQTFARQAFKIQVDADAAEFIKPTVRPDLQVHCDAKLFLAELNRQLDDGDYKSTQHAEWLHWCKRRVDRYPTVLPRHRRFNGFVNPYHFFEVLFQHLGSDEVIVCGNGTASVIPFQVAAVKKGQRMFANSGCASMGYDLPAAIGAAVAREGKRVICLAGDGSIQMNIQELQTVAHHQLPIKIFVLNNAGYLSIRQTQKNFFGNLVGESPHSGVTFPNMTKIAEAYGLLAARIDQADFSETLQSILRKTGPVVCEVLLDPDQEFEPRITSKLLPDGRMVSSPLEDMYPFLDEQEILDNMLIPPVEY